MTGRWFQIRRKAITAGCLAYLESAPDDEHARRELASPLCGLRVPRGSAWFAARATCVQAAAIHVIADKHADQDDRHCSSHARRALEHPLDDVAEAAWHEGLHALPVHELCRALAIAEDRLGQAGIAYDYSRGYTSKLI